MTLMMITPMNSTEEPFAMLSGTKRGTLTLAISMLKGMQRNSALMARQNQASRAALHLFQPAGDLEDRDPACNDVNGSQKLATREPSGKPEPLVLPGQFFAHLPTTFVKVVSTVERYADFTSCHLASKRLAREGMMSTDLSTMKRV